MYPAYNQFMDSYPSHHMNHNHHHHHPFPYQSWPHPGYGYYPGYFPAQMPTPAPAPAPPMYYGGYPAPPMPYPAVERPCYSPGNMPESYGHCCGCPNHQQDHRTKEENKVKIDEEAVKEAGGSPFVWIPQGFVKNAADEQEKEQSPHGVEKGRERSELSEEEKNFLNKLLPLIMEGSGSRNRWRDSSEGGDSAGKQGNQDAEKREIPFPLIWMPYDLSNNDTTPEKKEKEETTVGEECREENPKVMAPEKNSAPKVFPVKSVEESANEIPKSSSVRNVNGGKQDGKPSSSPRSSSLPPVCLRVDPVNKKRNGKGSSRSPSPPGDDKKKLHERPQESSSKDAGQPERKAKTIEVSERVTKKDEVKDQNLPKSQVEADKSKEVEKSADASNSSLADNVGGSEKVKVRRNLSEGEAATMIQSAYRGYEVRRWEPLRKLKQISDVRNEVAKLSNGISPDSVNDDKRRITIDETIMNLLLKLDTIQGLHPSIRDVRKSVARELVSLQEKIDQLSQKRPEIAPDHESDDEQLINDQGGQEKEELPGESTPKIHQEVSEGMAPVAVDNQLEILGMDKDDEKTGAASQLPVTESSEDANAKDITDVQGPFSVAENIKPGNCESQEGKVELSMAEKLHDSELPEGQIEREDDASEGKYLTEEPQEVVDDGASPTDGVTEEPQKALVDGELPEGQIEREDDASEGKNLTEEPQKTLVDGESGETVAEDDTKEKDLTEQPLDDVDENLDDVLENCTNVASESHDIPAEAPKLVELDAKDMKEVQISPPSPRNDDSVSAEFNKKLVEENQKMREMMQKLINAGNEQLSTISKLSGRVEDLEKKLSRKNRLKMRGKNHRASRKACRKSMNEI